MFGNIIGLEILDMSSKKILGLFQQCSAMEVH